MSTMIDVTALSQQVEAVMREAAALRSARSTNRLLRRILLLGLIVFVAVTLYSFYNLGNGFFAKPNLDKLLGKVQDRLNSKPDLYTKELQLLVDNSSPVLTKAFYDQSQKDLPKFMNAMEKEQDLLVQNLQEQFTDRLTKRYDTLLTEHEVILRNEFPLIKDEKVHDKMVHNLELACHNLVKKYYIEDMGEQMVALTDAWDQFPVADPPGKNQPPLNEQFTASLWLLVQHQMAYSDGMKGR